MRELEQIHFDYIIKSVDEHGLIIRIVDWYNENQCNLETALKERLIEIVSLNTKTNEILKSPALLNEIIKLKSNGYNDKKKLYALISLKNKCNDLINKKIRPYALWKMAHPIEQEFDYPDWLANLYNVLDWCKPDTQIDDFIISEVKVRIVEIEEILKIQYENIGKAAPK